MNRIVQVAKREYLDSIRSKTFIFSLLMTPLFIGVMIFINSQMPKIAGNPDQPPLRTIQYTDLTQQLTPKITILLDNYNHDNPDSILQYEQIPPEPDRDALIQNAKNQVLQNHLDAYFIIDADILDGPGQIRVYSSGNRIVDFEFTDSIVGLLRRAVIQQRCELNEITWDFFAQIDRYIPYATFDPAAASEKAVSEAEKITSMMVPFMFLFMMFFGIFVMGQQILTSVVEEKTSRIIEMLLSALTPFELMAGKIIGLTAVGLTIITVWASTVYAFASFRGINIPVGWEIIPCFVIYYILGFMLLTSVLAAVGSTCNTTKEAQSMMTPVTIIFVAPMMTWFILAQYPNGVLATVFSFIPPITPMIMMLRIAAAPDLPLWQIFATIALMLVSVPAIMWIAAKVFRTGILMYGKKPSLPEILRWLKTT